MSIESNDWENIKADYLRHVKDTLSAAGHPRSKEILDDVNSHLDQRFAELPPERQTWENMQAIITEMGPASDYAELLGTKTTASVNRKTTSSYFWLGSIAAVIIAVTIIIPKVIASPAGFIIEFKAVETFQPQTAKQLLDAFNDEIKFRVTTHHFRTEVSGNTLIGYICTNTKADKGAIVAILKESKKLSLISIKPATQKDLEKHYLRGQPSLTADNESLPAKQNEGSTPGKVGYLQTLINSAEPNNVVIVPNGTYTEPIEITRPLILKGSSPDNCVIELTADRPAIFINTKGNGNVIIEGLAVKWQLATSDDKIENRFALAVKDSKAELRNCSFLPLGNFDRSPVAVNAIGFSELSIENSHFEGFAYTICYGQGTKGKVENCTIRNSGHQGISLYDDTNVEIKGNIVAGSRYHGVRSTGGTLNMSDNLIINNKNRGIYLGNKSAMGVISNNVIIGNMTGIGSFAKSKVIIENNIIVNSGYAGIGMYKSCNLVIHNNIFQGNERGWILFEQDGNNENTVDKNTFWKNKIDTENFDKTADAISTDPCFIDANSGDFSLNAGLAMSHKQGLKNPTSLKLLWKKWKTSSPPRKVTQLSPIVTATTPAAFTNDVPPDLDKITVTFDQPMMDSSWSWVGSGKTFPKITGKPDYDNTRTTCTLPVKLEPATFYWIGINSPQYKNFQTETNVPARPYVILFATKDKDGNPTPIPDNLLEKAKLINSQSDK